MIPGSSTGEVVLSVRSVVSVREGARILDGVSFDVLDRLREGSTTGQIVSLLGRSGAGKTTLLRVMAGLDRPTSGAVRGVKDTHLGRHEVGIVFQDYPLIGHRTVLDNLTIAGRMGGLCRERAHKRAKELLERVGLAALADRWPAQLSGGQRQRVAIAQCLVLPRRVLLLDEPFSGLDPIAIAEVSQLITEVANDHDLNTVVIVTHDIHAAVGVSDTILLLGKRGKISKRLDLVDRGVAWNQGTEAQRATLEHEIEQAFREL